MERSKLLPVDSFAFEGAVTACEPFGNGHINDTYRVLTQTADGMKQTYVLQRINGTVFPHPRQVMENIRRVTDFLKEELTGEGRDPQRETLTVISTKDGDCCIETADGSVWRAYRFIENAVALERPETPRDFYQSAVAFGRFQQQLRDYPVETLHETIPDFHNTPKRYNAFEAALAQDVCGRAASVQEECAFVRERQAFYSVLEEAYRAGTLPRRVTHNDTKLNNVMLDAVTREPVCVLDLDTVMPGYSVTDFGDSIRFGACTAAEDEPDLSRVHLDIDLFRVYTEGYLAGCGGALTPGELALLPEGALLMTLECGMRFLTDYLMGDTYFKTAYPTHNLVRCRTQLRLAREMEQALPQLHRIVEECC